MNHPVYVNKDLQLILEEVKKNPKGFSRNVIMRFHTHVLHERETPSDNAKGRVRMKIASSLTPAFRSVVPVVPEFEITCKSSRRRTARMHAYIKDVCFTIQICGYTDILIYVGMHKHRPFCTYTTCEGGLHI